MFLGPIDTLRIDERMDRGMATREKRPTRIKALPASERYVGAQPPSGSPCMQVEFSPERFIRGQAPSHCSADSP